MRDVGLLESATYSAQSSFGDEESLIHLGLSTASGNAKYEDILSWIHNHIVEGQDPDAL